MTQIKQVEGEDAQSAMHWRLHTDGGGPRRRLYNMVCGRLHEERRNELHKPDWRVFGCLDV